MCHTLNFNKPFKIHLIEDILWRPSCSFAFCAFPAKYLLDCPPRLCSWVYVGDNNGMGHVSMLPIQYLENKPFNTSAFLYVVMTSCKDAKFIINEIPDHEHVLNIDAKIMIVYHNPRYC